jgi:hypothetical protein
MQTKIATNSPDPVGRLDPGLTQLLSRMGISWAEKGSGGGIEGHGDRDGVTVRELRLRKIYRGKIRSNLSATHTLWLLVESASLLDGSATSCYVLLRP